MATPDLTPYIDLSLYDVQPADLVQRALLDIAVKMPGWKPTDGHPALFHLEALALVGAEIVYALNRIPSATTMGLLSFLSIPRSDGAAATATVTFTLSDNLGHTLPAGTTVRWTSDATIVDFTTDTAVVVAAGATVSAPVAVTATVNSAAANGVTAGTVLQLMSAVPYIDTVTVASDVTAGADPESDTDYRTRAMQRFARLNETLARPEHFTAEALTYPQVERATTIDDYDGSTTSAGHVTVAVLGSNGATVSSGDKATILTDLDALAQANLAVHVVDPTINDVDVTATVMAKPGYVAADVQPAVLAALAGYLSPDTWPWAAKVRVNELIALLSDVDGVDYVETLTTPAADVTLTGAAPLAKLRTTSITVHTP